MKHTKTTKIITILSLLLFLWFIYYSYQSGVMDYVNDSIMFFVLSILIFALYHKLQMNTLTHIFLIIGFSLHNMGVFGFYNISPIGFQWDHVTHIVGIFAGTLLLFNMVHQHFSKKKLSNALLLCLLLLGGMGLGVIVELIEFGGYFLVGEGMGVLGHGPGDTVTILGESEWFNTMFDMIYNIVGAVLALIVSWFCYKR